MYEFFDEDFDQLELVEGALILNKAVNPETQDKWAELELARLLEDAEQALVHETDEQQKFESFIRLFFYEWGFAGDKDAYFSSDNAFIDKVLERKKGVPVSLGAIFLYLGRKLGFPVDGVSFPTQFLLKVTWYGQTPVYINPYNGEYVGQQTLRAWLIGMMARLLK